MIDSFKQVFILRIRIIYVVQHYIFDVFIPSMNILVTDNVGQSAELIERFENALVTW